MSARPYDLLIKNVRGATRFAVSPILASRENLRPGGGKLTDNVGG